MITKAGNDSDILENGGYQYSHKLTPAERAVYNKLKQNSRVTFCFKDFPEFKPGTMRNIFSKLKTAGLIELECRSPNAFYRIKGSSSNFPKKPLTIAPMTGSNLRKVQTDISAFLNSFPSEELCKVHDIHLMTAVKGIYALLEENRSYQMKAHSNDIVLYESEWSRNRTLKVFVHCTDNVSFYLKCSNNPIESSTKGFVCLAGFLAGIRMQLIYTLKETKNFCHESFANVEDWIVVSWHYGKDSAQEFSGERFNITFKMWCGLLARIYVHQQDKTAKLRLEVIQKPQKPLREVVAEKLGLCCGRCRTC